jgi:hypothetical protein
MEQIDAICRRERLGWRSIGIVGNNNAEAGALEIPGGDYFLDGLIANWLAIQFALKHYAHSRFAGHHVHALVAASFRYGIHW